MIDRKYIIHKPYLVKLVMLLQPLNFIRYQYRISSAVTASIYGSAAPFTGVRTSPHSADVYHADAMLFFPNVKIFLKIDFISVGKGQLINILYQYTFVISNNITIFVFKSSACQIM